MRRSFLLVSSVLIFMLLSTSAIGAPLSGKWQMTFDPDGPVVNDWMLFKENGSVQFGDDQGIYISCTYEIKKTSVVTTCNVRGKDNKIKFEVRNNFNELVNQSGAIYTKK